MWNCSENLFWAMYSVFGRSIYIVTCLYNYFIVSHLIYVLFYYILLFIFLSAYVFKLGRLLINIDKMSKNIELEGVLPTNWVEEVTIKEVPRVNTQTIKTTPVRFQQGKYNCIGQGIIRAKRSKWKGRPPRPPVNKNTNEGKVGISWASEHKWEPLLEHNYSVFFNYSCNNTHIIYLQ